MKTQTLDERWNATAKDTLVGRKIVKAEYLSKEEAKKYGWFSRPVAIYLDDGAILVPLRDDEGNDGGAIEITGTPPGFLPVLPVE